MTRIFHRFFMWKMDPISDFDIRLVFTLPPRDSTLQYKRCVHFWNNFPCLTILGPTYPTLWKEISCLCSLRCTLILYNLYRSCTSLWISKGKSVQGESKKSVICGAWCKIVPFLCNSPICCFFNIFLVFQWLKRKSTNLFFSQNQNFR